MEPGNGGETNAESPTIHPLNLTWIQKIGGLGRCFSFSKKGPFSGSSRLFWGV